MDHGCCVTAPVPEYPVLRQVSAGRTFLLRGRKYRVYPIGPGDPRRIAEAASEPSHGRDFDPARWVIGLAVAECGDGKGVKPTGPLGFYALAHSGDPNCYDDTLIFVRPDARGRDLSLLLLYAVYLELLRTSLSFRLREVIEHPRLRLFARCGFAPPVRKLADGKVEVSNFDLHAILSRIESEDEILDLSLSGASSLRH